MPVQTLVVPTHGIVCLGPNSIGLLRPWWHLFASGGGGGFGDCRKLEVTSNFLPSIPPEVGFLSLFPESALVCIGSMTCLHPCNTVERVLSDFRGWASGDLQQLILLLRTLLLRIRSSCCVESQHPYGEEV